MSPLQRSRSVNTARLRQYTGASQRVEVRMSTQQVDIPEELLSFLGESRLATRDTAAQVRAALAIHLFLDGVVSIGKAAELAEVPRVEFEELIVEMGLPTVRYELSDYEDDIRSFAEAERRKRTA